MVRISKKALTLQRKLQGQKKTWPLWEKFELIAWLDHTVTHKTVNFDETVIGHLERACDANYTIKQVRAKLKDLWTKIGQTGYPNQKCWEDVFDYGSKIFILKEDEQESIAQAYKRIEEYATTTLLETPRRTRGNSRPGDCRSSPLFSLETIVRPKRQQSVKKDHDGTASLPFALGGIKRSNRRGRRKALRPKRKKKTSLPPGPAINLQPMAIENVSSSEERQMKSEICTIDGQIMEDDIRADSAHKRREQAELGQNTQVAANEVQDSEEDNENMITTSLLFDSGSDSEASVQDDSLNQANSDFRRRIRFASSPEKAYQERIDKAIDEIKSLQQQVVRQQSKLGAYKKNKIELENEISTMREAQTERDRKSGGEFEATIEQKNRYIRDITMELHDRRILGRFTKNPFNPQDRSRRTPIKEVVEDIYVEIRNILYQQSGQKPSLAFFTALEDQTEFQSLIKRAFDTDSFLSIDINRVLSKLGSQEVVRLLTMSSLCEWIFEDDFPQFGEPYSELLMHYRESVWKLDGALALRNLDLAAHNSIIMSDDFRKHRIPKLAKELATRLSRALAPLFNKDSSNNVVSDLYGFPTWNQEKEDYETRYTRLRTIFERALMAKADSLLDPEVYELVLYSPGTKYSDRTMVAENMPEIEQDCDNLDDQVVDLCIEAAVFSYPKKELGNDGPMLIAEALVQSRNFCHFGDPQRDAGNLLVPARVLLRDR